jgi:hypothetical protein
MIMKILKKNKYSILSTFAKYSFIFIIGFSLLMPVIFISAEGGTIPGVQVKTQINNPLGPSLTTLPAFIEAILNIVLVVGVPIVTLAIIYSGFLFVKARGNPEELTKAKKTLMYTLIGAALLLGSFVRANAIKGTVDQIKSTERSIRLKARNGRSD